MFTIHTFFPLFNVIREFKMTVIILAILKTYYGLMTCNL